MLSDSPLSPLTISHSHCRSLRTHSLTRSLSLPLLTVVALLQPWQHLLCLRCLSPNLFKCHLQRSVALKPAARPRTARSLNSTLPSHVVLPLSRSRCLTTRLTLPTACRFAAAAAAASDSASADVAVLPLLLTRSSIFFVLRQSGCFSLVAFYEGAGATKSIVYVFYVDV